MIRYLVALCMVAAPVQAQMSAEAFDAETQGKTLFYGSDGVAYGVERYLPDRRVIWSFLDGRCKEGVWYPEGDQICFVYEAQGRPQGWVFAQREEGLAARFEGRGDVVDLYAAEDLGREMLCLGPEVGV
jgi:hypothetical protein